MEALGNGDAGAADYPSLDLLSLEPPPPPDGVPGGLALPVGGLVGGSDPVPEPGNILVLAAIFLTALLSRRFPLIFKRLGVVAGRRQAL